MAQDLNRSIKIYIDNSDAMKKASDLEKSISKLRGELKQLAAEGKKDSATSLKKEKDLRGLQDQYKNYMYTVRETDRVLKNLSGSTYKELIATRKILKRELEQEQRGTEVYTAKLKSYQAVQKQVSVAQKEMNGTLGAQGTIMSRAANGFNKYFGIVTTFLASITGISFTLRKLSQDAAQMEDTYADVRKTTGMTAEEVKVLNKELKKIDTRTSREELNKIAEAGGRIGVAKEEILGFTRAIDVANVALGDSFSGGPEQIATMLGKIRGLFKETKDMEIEKAFLSIGSVINELGANGAASEENIANFTTRLGSLPDALKPSVAETLALGAAFEESGIEAEIASRAYNIFLKQASVENEKFARVMGITADEVKNLINTNPFEFFLRFAESMRGMNAVDTALTLTELGISADGANKAIGAAANNTDRFRELMALSNEAFREGTSVMNEFNIKNNNAAAELDKRKKAFKDAAEELGSRLNPALLKSTNYVTYLVKLLPVLLDFLGKYGKYILYLATSYAVYTAAVKLNVLWNEKLKGVLTLNNILFKAKTAWLHLAKVAMLAYNVVLGFVTGNFIKMRAAWKLLTATMATNPIGLIAVAATAAIAGIIKLVQWLNRTSDATKALKSATQQYVSELVSEQRAAMHLFEAYKKTNPESETHLQIRKEIISKYGQYLKGLVDEKGNITDIGTAITAVNKGLREQIALKIRNAATDEIMEKSINKQTELTDKTMKRIEKQLGKDKGTLSDTIRNTINATVSDFVASGNKDYAQLQQALLKDIQQTYGVDAYKGVFNVKNVIADLVEEVKNSGDAVDEVKEKFAGMISEMTDVSSSVAETPTTDDPNSPVTPLSSPSSDKDKYQKKLDELNSYIAKEKNILLQKLLNDELTQEGYNRQLEFLERERLVKTMEIYEIGSDKRIEAENLLMEHKIAALKKIEDEERAHQTRLQQLREEADKARMEQNWKALNAIAKQNEENAKLEFERQNKQRAELIGLGMDFANEMGNLVAGSVTGNEDIVASSLKSIINMGLDLLKVQVQMAIAGATAQSLAQPDSVATFGASGLARAAVLVGLIEAAFAVVKGVVGSTLGKIGGGQSSSDPGSSSTQRVITQRAAGKYDVIGADDNRFYSGVPYLGVAQTGIVPRPALVGEYGPELIVSAPDFNRLQKHVNYPLVVRAIQESRVPQRAAGNYSTLPSAPTPLGSSGIDSRLLEDLRDLLLYLKLNKITAELNYHEFKKGETKIENIKNKAKRG